MESTTAANLEHLYEKLGYLDNYGTQILLVFAITLIVALVVAYSYTMIHMQAIRDDWPAQRCKPSVLPFAGLIYNPDPTTMSASDATKQNLEYCTQDTLKHVAADAVQPLTFAVQNLSAVAGDAAGAVDAGRGMFDKVRTNLAAAGDEVMGRAVNITIPIQQVVISFKDMMAKVQGILTAALFTSLGTYDTLKSVLGAIADLIVKILIALAAMIVIMWLIPFTWGAASAMTALFIAISVPMALILAFMADTLHINTGLHLPSAPKKMKCFAPATIIRLANRTAVPIRNICIGDFLANGGGMVTAKIVVCAKGSTMYCIDGVEVSDSHLVWDSTHEEWTRASDHSAAKLRQTHPPYSVLYCINTTTKQFRVGCGVGAGGGALLCSDWDEIVAPHQWAAVRDKIGPYRTWDAGLDPYMSVRMGGSGSGSTKRLRDIKLFDVLSPGRNIVYGIVELRDARSGAPLLQLLTSAGCFIDAHTDTTIGDYNVGLDRYEIPEP